MANPVFVDCPANTWTLVATAVFSGQLWRARTSVNYLHTYRETGDPAPTESSEGMKIFQDGEPDFEPISSSNSIDVYIYAIGSDGRVRIDVA